MSSESWTYHLYYSGDTYCLTGSRRLENIDKAGTWYSSDGYTALTHYLFSRRSLRTNGRTLFSCAPEKFVPPATFSLRFSLKILSRIYNVSGFKRDVLNISKSRQLPLSRIPESVSPSFSGVVVGSESVHEVLSSRDCLVSTVSSVVSTSQARSGQLPEGTLDSHPGGTAFCGDTRLYPVGTPSCGDIRTRRSSVKTKKYKLLC